MKSWQPTIWRRLVAVTQLEIVQAIVVGLVAVTLRFLPFFRGQTILFGDNFSLMVPGKIFISTWLQQGVVPLWNPNIFAGLSLVGDINQSLWYPTTLLFIWFSPTTALNLTVLIHQFLAFMGMYVLTRRVLQLGNSHTSHRFSLHHVSLMAGLLWMFSMQVTSALNNLSILQSIIWLPWIVWAAVSANVWWLSFFVILQIAAGYPQHVLYSVGLAGIFSGFLSIFWVAPKEKQRLNPVAWFRLWLISGVAVLIVTAGIWLPFVSTLQQSTRPHQSVVQAATGSLHPSDLVKMVVPYFFENPLLGIKWGPLWNGMSNAVPYISWFGLCVLGISVLRRKQWLAVDYGLLGLSLLSFVLAFGPLLPGFSWLTSLMPGMQSMRGVSTVLMVTNLTLILWLARQLLRITPSRLEHSLVLAIGCFVLVVAGVSGYFLVTSFQSWWWQVNNLFGGRLVDSAFHTIDRDYLIGLSILSNVGANALFLIILWWLAFFSHWKFRQWLIVWILFAELLINSVGLFFFAPADVYDSRVDGLSSINQLYNPQARTLVRNFNEPYTDFGAYSDALIVREPFSDSYVNDQELESYAHLQRMKTGLTPDWNVAAGVRVINGYTTLLPESIQIIFGDQQKPVGINYLTPISLDNSNLAEWSVGNYLVDTWFPKKSETEFAGLTEVASYEWWKLYQLPALPRMRWLKDTFESPSLSISEWQETPNEISVSFSLPGGSDNQPQSRELLFADRYEPGWRAWANGVEVSVVDYRGMRQFIIPESVLPVANLFQASESGQVAQVAPDESEQKKTVSIKLIQRYQPWEWEVGWKVSVMGLLVSAGWLVCVTVRSFRVKHMTGKS